MTPAADQEESARGTDGVPRTEAWLSQSALRSGFLALGVGGGASASGAGPGHGDGTGGGVVRLRMRSCSSGEEFFIGPFN